jgi:hypothetical protein
MTKNGRPAMETLEFDEEDAQPVEPEAENEELDQKARENDPPTGVTERGFVKAGRFDHEREVGWFV